MDYDGRDNVLRLLDNVIEKLTSYIADEDKQSEANEDIFVLYNSLVDELDYYISSVESDSYDSGYEDGQSYYENDYDTGYSDGYDEGYSEGYNDAEDDLQD